jgi:hypothetical protein
MTNSAGRVGLFRIVFAIGYLWHVSLFDMSAIAGAPESTRALLPFVQLLPSGVSVGALHGLEMLLVAALILLLVGLWVPVSTALVLCAGLAREGYLSQFDIENGNLMPVLLIPLIAFANARWGATYSLDAWRARERGGTPIDGRDDAWPFAVLARSSIVLLAVLFPMAAVLKVTGNGTWLQNTQLLLHLSAERSVEASVMGLPSNPLVPWLFANASWGLPMQLGVVLFEFSFVFMLLGGTVRRVLLVLAMLFHALSALWLLVSFNGVLAAYATLVDWESGWGRLRDLGPMPALRQRAASLGVAGWSILACGFAVLVAGSWHAGTSAVFNVWGVVNWQLPWLVVAPLAIAALVRRLWRGEPSVTE